MTNATEMTRIRMMPSMMMNVVFHTRDNDVSSSHDGGLTTNSKARKERKEFHKDDDNSLSLLFLLRAS